MVFGFREDQRPFPVDKTWTKNGEPWTIAWFVPLKSWVVRVSRLSGSWKTTCTMITAWEICWAKLLEIWSHNGSKESHRDAPGILMMPIPGMAILNFGFTYWLKGSSWIFPLVHLCSKVHVLVHTSTSLWVARVKLPSKPGTWGNETSPGQDLEICLLVLR